MNKFGATWTTSTLIPKLLNYLTQPKTSFIHRMTVFACIAACAKYLSPNQNNEFVIPHLTKHLKDKIPNVRFFLIKKLSTLGPNLDNSGKDKVKA